VATVRSGYCEVCVCVYVCVCVRLSGALEISSGLRHKQFSTVQFERKKVCKPGQPLGVMCGTAQAVEVFRVLEAANCERCNQPRGTVKCRIFWAG